MILNQDHTAAALQHREAGILMPVFSIPGKYGIGDFSHDTFRFIEDAAAAGFSIWQILPLQPVGYGESPYQPYSSFAGEPLYISLEGLKKEDLLQDFVSFQGDANAVDYEAVRAYKEPYFQKAFEAFTEKKKNQEDPLIQAYEEFIQEAFWLDRYALFMALKKKNGMRSWTEWDSTDQNMEIPQSEELARECEYQKFLQFIFLRQWTEILEFARGKHLTVMGDIPIYVGGDSADVWQFRDAFLLDEKGRPSLLAGCPPDYFSEEGQLWGNPIYDWKGLQKNGFDFWKKRLAWNRKLADVIRFDHFIGFDRYWAVPQGEHTARHGHYEDGPSYAFFDAMFDAIPNLMIVAEDLGVLRPEAARLRDHYGLLGMRIGQYSLGPVEEKQHFILPESCIVYPGNHDNDPVNGWYASLPKSERKFANRVFHRLKLKGKTPADKVVDYCLKADPRIAIIAMQDLLNLGAETRINHPGTIGGSNWRWRMHDFARFEALIPSVRKKLKQTGRLPQPTEAD